MSVLEVNNLKKIYTSRQGGNQVEALLINPLSRWLFDHAVMGNARVEITAFDTAARPAALTCRILEDEAHAE